MLKAYTVQSITSIEVINDYTDNSNCNHSHIAIFTLLSLAVALRTWKF